MKTNALALRQGLGGILKKLQQTGQPIVIEKGRQPVAVLITMEDYQSRFIDHHTHEMKQKLLSEFQQNQIQDEPFSLAQSKIQVQVI